EKDGDLPTIGMYGIGMKRAVFKIGNEALVQSNSKDGFFEVEYSKSWLNPKNEEWNLPIVRSTTKAGDKGVTITITDVRNEPAKLFANNSFINRLKSEISEHFGYIMQKGFLIKVNGEELTPLTQQLIFREYSNQAGIRPFDYESTFKGVNIKVTVGFFRKLARESEIDDELYGSREKETAGVSVVCNDRVILLSDRSMKSGWGDGSVPKYHPQFRAIAGLIVFYSANAERLPISTTKRDLDVGSDVYLKARKAMMEGLKIFTDFTNRWKGMEEETNTYFDGEARADAKTEVVLARTYGRSPRGDVGAKKFVPILPLPESKNPRRRISFVRNEAQINQVSKHLFGEPDVHPSDVGAECFDRILREAKKR
ncbi:MAG: ATP-binding protein, partial [Gammaproteobacteria bacterium]|nr:ATP-binding protein [Gammaproteobacteria bacterium]